MALHKDLTGADLHEPKGIATATSGQIYVADGAGSGTWQAKNADALTFNQHYIQDQMPTINTASSAFFFVPVKAELTTLTAILHGPIDGGDKTLSIYINGVLFADSLIVPTAGSAAGVKSTRTLSTANTVAAGSVVEVRSNGASAMAAKATIQLGFRAKA